MPTLPGGAEWIIILLIVLLLFGARKLPDLAGSVGTSIKEFRKASKEAMRDDEDDAGKSDDERDDAPAVTGESDREA